MIVKNKVYALFVILFLAALACNVPTPSIQSTTQAAEPPSSGPAATQEQSATSAPTSPPVVNITHLMTPASDGTNGAMTYDTDSSGTGPDKRAPYGDSYDRNLLERPFLKDMTYVPDLDIQTFGLAQSTDWFYVSIKLIGTDPNNPMGIQYAVELDTNMDGFGDYIIVAKPPYTDQWTTSNVQVFADKNHDTSGRSADKSDAPITTDGYETLIFDGGKGVGDDLDLAWVKMSGDGKSTIQFAFKSSWAGSQFLYGVIADAGLKDVTKLDYVDRFTQTEAGSPVRDKKDYPLQSLYSVDNTCRQPFGFAPNGYEPMICPSNAPVPNGNSSNNSPSGCQPPGGSCPAGYYWWPDPHCACSITPYKP